jgi:hypothetical protein
MRGKELEGPERIKVEGRYWEGQRIVIWRKRRGETSV